MAMVTCLLENQRVDLFTEKYWQDLEQDFMPFAGYCLALTDEELADFGWEVF